MEVIGHPNYIVYRDGRVQNKKTKRYLKPSLNTNGYYRMTLCTNGVEKRIYLHRLLALHYISNPHNYPLIDHIDRDPLNNDISNLRWATQSINMGNATIRRDNTSGHKKIYYMKRDNKWKFSTYISRAKKCKTFTTKTDALCYKYIYLLKLRCQI